ncbi:hypothetical protein GC207_10310 [bacterium]|nr:hypothetical protein [bacterium]
MDSERTQDSSELGCVVTYRQAWLEFTQGASGHVRGYFSDIPMKPGLAPTHSMYPSLERLSDPTNHDDTVVEALIFVDMKSHLSGDEFWLAIKRMLAVGVAKDKIKAPFGKRRPKNSIPAKHHKKPIELAIEPGPTRQI